MTEPQPPRDFLQDFAGKLLNALPPPDREAFRASEPEAISDPQAAVPLLLQRIEEALRAKEEQDSPVTTATPEATWEEVFARAPFFLCVLRGEDFVFELANQAFYQLVGHREFIGKRLADALPEVRDQPFLDILRDVLRTGEAFRAVEMSVRLQHTPGEDPEERFVSFVYQRTHQEDGRGPGILVHGVDLTEQVRARAALEDSAARAGLLLSRLEAVLDALPVGVVIADASGKLEMMNPALAQLWGGESPRRAMHEFAESRAWWDETGRPIAPDEWALARAVRHGETSLNEEIEIEGFDGERRIILNSALPIRDPSSEIVGAVAVSLDITDRRRAEKELFRREQEFRALVEHNPDIIARFDRQHRHLYVNPAAAKATGVPTAEFIGRTNAELGMPDSLCELWQGAGDRCFETGEVQEVEFEFLTPEGPRLFHGRVIPERSLEGDVETILFTTRDVTELRRTEEEIRRREEYYRALIEHSADLIMVLNPDGTTRYASPSAERILGYTPAELEALTEVVLVHPDDVEPLRETLAIALASPGASPVLEARVRSRDGSWRVLDGSGIALPDSVTPGVVVNARDITEERLRVEELRRRDAVLEAVGFAAEQFLRADRWEDVIDPVLSRLGGATRSSRAYLFELTVPATGESGEPGEARLRQGFEWTAEGIEPQIQNTELQDFSFGELGLADWEVAYRRNEAVYADVIDLPPAARRHLEEQGIRSMVTVPVFVDGKWWGVLGFDECSADRAWSESEREVLRVASETLGAAIQRQHADSRVRESEQRFRALVENVQEVIAILNADGTVRYLSPAYQSVTGLSPEKRIGRSGFDRIHPDDMTRMRSVYLALLDDPGGLIHTHVRIAHVDGSWRTIELTGKNLLHDPIVHGIVVTYGDVTERLQLEEQLLQAQKMEAVGRLAGGVAHDFNNLLMVIAGNTDFALGELPEGSPARGDLEEVRQAAERASQLTQQLLAFSRKQVLAPELLVLDDVVGSAEKLLRRLIGEDIELVTDYGAPGGHVRADLTQINQVIINLAINARDAMPGGGKLTICTRNRVVTASSSDRGGYPVAPGSYVVLTVQDTGEGMDPEVLAHAFEPFFTTKEVGKGTGLGLSTVYGVVKQSGGYVWAESEQGAGTTFHLYLPREGPRPEKRAQVQSQPARGSGQTVLMVEDEHSVRTLVHRVLSRAGYRVLTAPDGEEALRVAAAHSNEIDLLITDVVMPGMSGRDLAEQLLASRPEIRVLYMSGYMDDAVLRKGVGVRGIQLLQKPFAPSDLLARVAQILALHEGS